MKTFITAYSEHISFTLASQNKWFMYVGQPAITQRKLIFGGDSALLNRFDVLAKNGADNLL